MDAINGLPFNGWRCELSCGHYKNPLVLCLIWVHSNAFHYAIFLIDNISINNSKEYHGEIITIKINTLKTAKNCNQTSRMIIQKKNGSSDAHWYGLIERLFLFTKLSRGATF